ncbi:hydroxyproline-2-epimerase [Rhodovibrio sodomensis]|uniref:Hydroxyproline-2-epimerase n=1 Tax=Rhodovibrio sodomensis TaxID=1088 RepID=A0ABS1DFU8_9PROT|nr:4-hydroxyproline epimerase [Rhodovibrio sodomensis]MBK1669346.1 hydroxyproline-2-epimerase [Rhodovibrio sodomensis]
MAIGRPNTFPCIDGHTCGNPVRLVTAGGPRLDGATMSERRQDFLARYDWIRTGLMFEPRGHDMMSGAILYPPTTPDGDTGVLYIETSGCLPMCGHGTIGTVTFALERGLVQPAEPGVVRLDTPAGRVTAQYRARGDKVEAVKITNVPAFLFAQGVEIEVTGLGTLTLDVAYGGNFYAILEPQANFAGLEAISAADVLAWSPEVRAAVNAALDAVHPQDPTIRGVSHVMWTGAPQAAGAHARNAVFYGKRAIDRSPCGTGTSARMAQLAARGELGVGDAFVHESIIGSVFTGRVEAATEVAGTPAIQPSVEGWAVITGFNTIFLDESDPYVSGFSVG